MPEIKLFFPKNNHTFHSPMVAATGKYNRPERIRGVLSSTADTTTYPGTLHVMHHNLWALFFGPVVPHQDYLLHIYDQLDPDVHKDVNLRVLAAVGAPKINITFPAAGEILFDRDVPVIGFTTATSVTDVRIIHAGNLDLLPAETLPLAPVAKSWSASFTIPTAYPCPGTSPDYTIHAEDTSGPPFPNNSDVVLDRATFCPAMSKGSKNGQAIKSKAKKTKVTKKKKKTRARK